MTPDGAVAKAAIGRNSVVMTRCFIRFSMTANALLCIWLRAECAAHDKAGECPLTAPITAVFGKRIIGIGNARVIEDVHRGCRQWPRSRIVWRLYESQKRRGGYDWTAA